MKKNKLNLLVYTLSEPKLNQGLGNVVLNVANNLPFEKKILFPVGRVKKLLFYSFLSPIWFALKVKKINPDIVIVHSAEASFDPILAKKLFGGDYKILTVAHGLNSGMLKAYSAEKKKGNTNSKRIFELNLKISAFRSKFIYLSDKVIAVSNYVKEELAKDYGTKSVVINNGVNKTKAGKLKKKFETILFGGNLYWLKGLHYLILANLQLKKPKTILAVGLAKNQQEFLKNNYNCSNVVFKNSMSFKKFEILFKENDVFAMPSIYESFGIVYLQALANKMPVIASKNTGAEDIIVNKFNGCLTKKASVNEIKEALEFIDKNFEKISAAAKLEKRFLWKNIAKEYKNEIFALHECTESK
jgi:glycosyltransferase involved in cell wall biosynthesis